MDNNNNNNNGRQGDIFIYFLLGTISIESNIHKPSPSSSSSSSAQRAFSSVDAVVDVVVIPRCRSKLSLIQYQSITFEKHNRKLMNERCYPKKYILAYSIFDIAYSKQRKKYIFQINIACESEQTEQVIQKMWIHIEFFFYFQLIFRADHQRCSLSHWICSLSITLHILCTQCVCVHILFMVYFLNDFAAITYCIVRIVLW